MARRRFESRLEKSESPLLKKLFKIIIEKKSTLCVAADVGTKAKLDKLLESVGEHVCMIKIHSDDFEEDAREIVETVDKYKQKYNFLVFDDRKFHELPTKIRSIYERSFVKHADIVTVWPSSHDAIRALEAGSKMVNEPRGCFALCETSFEDIFIKRNADQSLSIAESNKPFCVGIIGQELNIKDEDNMIKATPGVHLEKRRDTEAVQNWRGPKEVVANGTDVIIVGRGIIGKPEDEWNETARRYKETAYGAYLDATTCCD